MSKIQITKKEYEERCKKDEPALRSCWMNKEWNILILESMFNDINTTPLKRYFIWEMLKEIKNV